MESNNTFGQGLSTDFNPLSQPANSYIDAKNMMIVDDIFAMNNEKGNLLSALTPVGYKIIGYCVIDEDIVVFLTNNISSEIGYIRNDTYFMYVNDPALNFNTQHQIDATGRKVFNDDRVAYFTDDFNPPRYVNLDRPYTNADDLSLFTAFDIPEITVTDVIDGGSLGVGAYHFAARYVAFDGTATAFSFVTGIVPIVDESEGTIRKLYDGAAPGTSSNKAITMTVSNIDTDFEFIDIAVIRYEGLSTTPVVEIFTRRSTTPVLNITYRGTEDIVAEATLDELNQLTGLYAKAKCIEQKDNRLFLSNLEGVPVNHLFFQDIANNIRLKWIIEEITASEASSYKGDYKDPLLTYDKKGYRRSEVYSFGIGFIYKNGYRTPVYHIPGYDAVDTPAAAGYLGTFISAEVYPPGAGYPAGNVRHHRMPTLIDEPHYVEGPPAVIRVLGVELDSVAFLTSLPDEVTGVFLVRQERTSVDKSVLAQGICHTIAYYDDDSTESYGAKDYIHHKYWNISPLNGNVIIDNGAFSGGGLQLGLFDKTVGERFYTDYYDGDLSPEYYQPADGISMTAFLSPETVITQEGINPTSLKRELLMSGSSILSDEFQGDVNIDLMIGSVENSQAPKAYTYQDYYQISTVFTAKEYPVEDSMYVRPAGSGLFTFDNVNKQWFGFALAGFPGAATDPFYAFGSNDYFITGINDDFDDYNMPGANVITLSSNWDNFNNKFTYTVNAASGSDSRYLYNAYRANPNQYGAVTNAEYLLVYSNLDKSSITGISFFNGDTFISKFAYHNACNVRLHLYGPALLASNDDRNIYDYEYVGDPSYIEGIRFRNINYFYVESDINCNYRHRPFDEASGTSGVDYYPHTGTPNDIMGGPAPSQGHSTGYNLQYSLENGAIKYYTLPLGYEEVIGYPNRTIYSEQAFEGEVADKYRKFLVNSYHDIPRNKGEIWNTFVQNNTLYLHTTDSLWSTFINQREMLQGTTGDIYVGAGGVFAAPSKEMLTIDGGHAGTQSQWAGVTTPYGYVFVDAKRKKVYVMTQGLQDISQVGMRKFFIDNLNTPIDNPVELKGLVGTWDSKNSRVLLTNHNDDWTLSYCFLNNKWISFHDYKPRTYMSKGNDLYSQLPDHVHKHNIGNYGVYYGTEYDSTITLVAADQPQLTKVYDNIVVYSESTKIDTKNNFIKVRDNTFSQCHIWNSIQNTGEFDLLFNSPDFYDVNIRYVEGRYQIVIPRNKVDKDLTTQDDTDIIDYPHMDTTWEDRIRDQYSVFKFIYDNKDNYKFVVNLIKILWRQSVR